MCPGKSRLHPACSNFSSMWLFELGCLPPKKRINGRACIEIWRTHLWTLNLYPKQKKNAVREQIDINWVTGARFEAFAGGFVSFSPITNNVFNRNSMLSNENVLETFQKEIRLGGSV